MADLKLLQAGASELGLGLTREQLAAFSQYMNELLKWNQRANLTAITAPEEIQTKHFLDSLSCLLAFPGVQPPSSVQDGRDLLEHLREGDGLACVDVGSGPGFPGLPLKICLPEMKLSLIESVGKKTAFLSNLVQLLNLEGTEVLTARAEELAHDRRHRERYDVVVARAVSRVAVVAELCLPLAKVGGRVIAPKKADVEAEMEEGRYAVETLGGVYLDPVPVDLSLLPERRLLVVMEKRSPTPTRFPRRSGIPSKRPLTGTV